MKKLILCLLLIAMTATPAFALEVPMWRTSATAIGKDANVELAVESGDLVLVWITANNHLNGDAPTGASDAASGLYWDHGGHVFYQANGKFQRTRMFAKPHLVTAAGTLTISTSSPGATTSLIIAVAIGGMTLIDAQPDLVNSLDRTMRQKKFNGQCIGCNAPIMPGATPVVPLSGQTLAFLTTSLLIGAVANESDPGAITAPSGWTQRVAISTTTGAKKTLSKLSLSLSSTTGVTGPVTTWGSTTASRANCHVFEIQPLQ